MSSNVTLLLVDLQKDFHPGGSLAIPKADEDAERTASLIRDHGSKIHRIVATLDSHHRLHIAHPLFWVDNDGNHPSPFTIITAEDIEKGTWKPRENVKLSLEELFDASIFPQSEKVLDSSTGTFDLPSYCLEYARRLEAKGRFKICIWPEHCLIGSPGHCVVDKIHSAMMDWVDKTGGSIEWVFKGENLLTEMFSALEAEVPVTKSTSFNGVLQDSLTTSDLLLVCGQALSHCVNHTTRDIVKRWPKDQTSKVCLLKDCCSSVPGFEEAGESFLSDMRDLGVRILSASDAAAELL